MFSNDGLKVTVESPKWLQIWKHGSTEPISLTNFVQIHHETSRSDKDGDILYLAGTCENNGGNFTDLEGNPTPGDPIDILFNEDDERAYIEAMNPHTGEVFGFYYGDWGELEDDEFLEGNAYVGDSSLKSRIPSTMPESGVPHEKS